MFVWVYLLGAALKQHILLALVQASFPHGPEVQDAVLPLQQLIQDVYHADATHTTPNAQLKELSTSSYSHITIYCL